MHANALVQPANTFSANKRQSLAQDAIASSALGRADHEPCADGVKRVEAAVGRRAGQSAAEEVDSG